jgi:hypothetical protein
MFVPEPQKHKVPTNGPQNWTPGAGFGRDLHYLSKRKGSQSARGRPWAAEGRALTENPVPDFAVYFFALTEKPEPLVNCFINFPDRRRDERAEATGPHLQQPRPEVRGEAGARQTQAPSTSERELTRFKDGREHSKTFSLVSSSSIAVTWIESIGIHVGSDSNQVTQRP